VQHLLIFAQDIDGGERLHQSRQRRRMPIRGDGQIVDCPQIREAELGRDDPETVFPIPLPRAE